MASAFPFDRTDRGVVFLPLYTCTPEQVLPTLCCGGSLEILPGFDVDRVADACTRATTFDAVPTILSRLLENAPLHKLFKLKWILFASEPMPVHLLKRWWDVLPGVETHQFFGMTELLTLTAASHTMLQGEPGTVGRAFPTTSVTLDPMDTHTDGSGSVQEVIVVGISSDRWGETPVVVAVPKKGGVVTAESLLRHCRNELPSFERPSAAALVSSLPTTGIGKGDKATVRRLIADGEIELVTAG